LAFLLILAFSEKTKDDDEDENDIVVTLFSDGFKSMKELARERYQFKFHARFWSWKHQPVKNAAVSDANGNKNLISEGRIGDHAPVRAQAGASLRRRWRMPSVQGDGTRLSA
jgi:hypothetical protein